MQRWPFRSFAEKKWFTTADAIELPDYLSALRRRRSSAALSLASAMR